MQMKRLQGIMSWFVVLSEVSHVFCCVLPSVFSILTVLVGMGVLGALPFGLNGMHDVMHDWEIPIILTSAVILMLGWSLQIISKRMDCHDTGCGHEPCEPKKKKTDRILRIATFLFLINVTIYTFVHIPQMQNAQNAVSEHIGHDDHDHHHDH